MKKTLNLTYFYASAVADALGACAEFKTPAEIRRLYGTIDRYLPGSPFGFKPGEATDDSQMCLATLKGLMQWEKNKRDDTAAVYVLAELALWYGSHPPDVGGLTSSALRCERLAGGYRAWIKSGQRSAGNGGLMRANAPFIAGYRGDELITVTAVTTALTHADPRCVMNAVHLALVLEAAENAGNTPEGFEGALKAAENLASHVPLISKALTEQLGIYYPEDLAEAAEAVLLYVRADAGLISQSGYTLDTYHAALCHASAGVNYMDVVSRACHLGDDADTVACVAGMLAAAKGYEAPAELVKDLKMGASWSGWQRSMPVHEHVQAYLEG